MSFEQEIATFDRLQPELQRQYGDQYVAIYQGKEIGHNRDRNALQEQILEEFGEIHCFIERADTIEPRKARFPSIRVVSELKE